MGIRSDNGHARDPRGSLSPTQSRGLAGGWIAVCLVAAVANLGFGQCSVNRTVGDGVCLSCHTGVTASDKTEFPQSPHRRMACESCHGPGYLHVRNAGRDGLFIDNPERAPFTASVAFCGNCHAAEVEGFMKTAHGESEVMTCNGCHDVHRRQAMAVASSTPRLETSGYVQLCGDCHGVQTSQFLVSGHAVKDVATCRACHDMHTETTLTASPVDNSLCLQCHASAALGFTSDAAVDAHTGIFHPVDPAGSGASRCTACHLPPLQRFDQQDGPHDHTLFTIPPAATIAALEAGVFPAPPNSCAGIMGCHDPSVPGNGIPHNVDSIAVNENLQAVYEATWAGP